MTPEQQPGLPATLDAWLHHLETLHSREIDLGLDRVRQVAQRLQLPLQSAANRPRVMTFAGTNGKGSTLAMTEAMALAAGLKVGSYTSPHFLHFNERIRIQGQPVSDASIMHAFERIEAARTTPDEASISLSYFEFATLAGLLLFQDAGLDLWLLEVGLGGRLDAVNIVDTDVAVLVTVALDHQAWLGDTLDAIGHEKAGIFRAGKPVVLGSRQLPNSVFAAASLLGVKPLQLGVDFDRQDDASARIWHWQGKQLDTRTSGLESLQLDALPLNNLPPDNAATAIQALLLAYPDLSKAAIHQGLAQVQMTGRMQRIGQWLLDVAHNPEAAEYLARRLAENNSKKRVALVGMMADKDITATLKPLIPLVDGWIVTALPLPRAEHPQKLAERVRQLGGRILAVDDDAAGHQAYAVACQQLAGDCDELLVMGSFFTLSQVLQHLQNDEAWSCVTV
ncbi:bifunctional tetrahydrofolate synthase/dihydrofolate synthase [Marinospirillum alkaliphilum]|uniref:Dihydrofolate synthase/folylpolyglutamate synthase n=1 Tax=Marinospirillum alkaliphilum DSM 21637 TaxID=1122209 RepID=A0A1K1X507_9GAMM|nr:bifunctional tetrahydrofolate synthase/dihydrofolate synthase [Marinospirillum alkaliphilum]SFX44236.1 dihydrofolate synthase / folylpolyglutamate synthase [Marinospirillum alkaliphilum DSM 21637]